MVFKSPVLLINKELSAEKSVESSLIYTYLFLYLNG